MNDHQYARDANGRWVNAKVTKYRKHSTYFCDCPSRHRMKLVKPSGTLGKRGFCDYFAHVVKRSKHSTAASRIPSCAHGGESRLHRMAKQRLRESVGRYRLTAFHCTQCGKEEHVNTAGCNVDIEVRSSDGRWRYDCLLRRGTTPIAALEVVHTHRTSDQKAAAVRASGIEIFEFSADEVMEKLAGGAKDVKELENLQMRIGKCQECLVQNALKWQRDCYVEELMELMRQEESIAFHYARMERLQRMLAVEPWLQKCKCLLLLGLKQRVMISIPRIGQVTCSKAELWENGVIASGFNLTLPTRQICIVLIQNDSDVYHVNWKHPSVQRDFHVFIKCSTIHNKLSSLAVEQVCFNDCRWALLKNMERIRGICANCGKYRHTSEACQSKFCIRCGRTGHLKTKCFANTNAFGEFVS